MSIFRSRTWQPYYRRQRFVPSVSNDVNVSVGTASLSLTTFPATVSYDVNVAVGTAALTLTPQAATVSLDVDVAVGTAHLTLATQPASVSYDVNVAVNTAALTLTTFPAEIDTGDVSVDVGTVALTLTTYPAAITATDAPRRTGGRTRRKVRYIVEVEGERIEVSSLTQAQSVLQQAAELAEQSAPQDVRRTGTRVKPPKVTVKTASGNKTTAKTLTETVETAQRQINAIYRKAYEAIEQEREISRLIQAKIERDEDDEEAVLLLFG